jgi:hypothetical protein
MHQERGVDYILSIEPGGFQVAARRKRRQNEAIFTGVNFINQEAAVRLAARLRTRTVRKDIIRDEKDTGIGQVQWSIVLDFNSRADGR